ncbi:hypothetical protein CDL12_09254 [Handroanthus impetiginosus]|uniref:Uncharacterized protein n=1 Tax=Handroanthus impetiginosus TaxID=429701 RepID=A0A2G9HKN2_9LAMI|nr:hypothetical protein CDL12_09254 [Handroanthus impetiginosus]
MGRLKAYPPAKSLELLSANLAWANRAGKIEMRHMLKLDRTKKDTIRAVREKKLLLELYTKEVGMGRKFLESEVGKVALEAASTKAVSKVKGFEEFEELVLDRAEEIYEQTVQDCRKILHGTGRVSDEGLLPLDPWLPFHFTQDWGMVNAEDADSKATGEDSPQA